MFRVQLRKKSPGDGIPPPGTDGVKCLLIYFWAHLNPIPSLQIYFRASESIYPNISGSLQPAEKRSTVKLCWFNHYQHFIFARLHAFALYIRPKIHMGNSTTNRPGMYIYHTFSDFLTKIHRGVVLGAEFNFGIYFFVRLKANKMYEAAKCPFRVKYTFLFLF